MFNLFKKKTPQARLQSQYEKLVEETFKLSTVDRNASDAKHAEADLIATEMKRLEELDNNESV